ncbi:MAG: damage-inducible protein DinB [Oceanospirillaceae bacterium]|nr:damage-inducible protein DinB [Oceanospirillaceae bacterium]
MDMKSHFELLASYNQWMNNKVYEAASRLSEAELARDRGAFFSSILGTLNHLVVGDTLWLKRFATLPGCEAALREVAELPDPESLNQVVFSDLEALLERRVWLDEQIVRWIGRLSEQDLTQVLGYHNTKGVRSDKRLSSLLLHFFNHQTHHRGQVSTLLCQAGVDVGVTDLLALIPNESQA